MEEALLTKNEDEGTEKDEQRWKGERSGLIKELKKLSSIAAPMVAVTVTDFFLQTVSVMMVGHLSELSLSSVAIATSFSNVTGFSLLVGMAGGLETLCGQAYGAEQYQKLGIYTCCSMMSLALVCLPVCVLWIFMDKLLILMGQDPLISIEAAKYSIWLIPPLFAFAFLQPMIRYLQTQGLIFPMLLSTLAVLGFHIPVCWLLVYKLELGNIGAALSIGCAYWLNVIILAVYIKYSAACEKSRIFFSKDVLSCFGEYFYFGVPSALMVCLEWWSFELLILLSGLLPNPQLETSVLTTCLSTTSLHYFIPYGISVAASTRVSNELGAGNYRSAQISVSAALILAIIESFTLSIALFFCRSLLGRVYSNEGEVIDNVKKMVPLVCLSFIVDSIQTVVGGVARGCGWQHLGAFVNLGAYYLFGVPLAASLAFLFHLRGIGLWIGILAGSTIQATSFALITAFTNWQKQAANARERIFRDTVSGAVVRLDRANDSGLQSLLQSHL